jgi:hypothetical protein
MMDSPHFEKKETPHPALMRCGMGILRQITLEILLIFDADQNRLM